MTARTAAVACAVVVVGCGGGVGSRAPASTRQSPPLAVSGAPAAAAAPDAHGAFAPREDPPFADPPSPLRGHLATGEPRPGARAVRFDVDGLPVATWGKPRPGAGFTLHRIPDGWRLFVRTTLYAEVIVSQSAAFDEPGTSPVGFSGFTAGNFGGGVAPDCGPGHLGRRLTVWGGLAPAGWTDDGVDVEMEEGDYELATCSGVPKRGLRGRAMAVVRGYVYALRVREEPDAGGEGDESLLVFLPRGALVSASADPATPVETSNTGTFTRLTLRLERGSAGTASVRVSPASLRLWQRLRSGNTAVQAFDDPAHVNDDLLVGVDVAWQGAARFGSVTLAVPKTADRRAFAGVLAAARVAGGR